MPLGVLFGMVRFCARKTHELAKEAVGHLTSLGHELVGVHTGMKRTRSPMR